MTEPAWLQWSRGELGVKETPGPVSTKRIQDYRRFANCPLGGDDGVVPWCAIFVNAALQSVGVKGSGNAMARGFLNWGVPLPGPAIGAITVISSSRGPTSGHVFFYLRETATHVIGLGGNQGDACSIASFPKWRVLGYRWPAGLPLPAKIGAVVAADASPSKPVKDS